MSKEIEINFCTDEAVFMVKSIVVPRAGETISIIGNNYRIDAVSWALDYAEKSLRDRALRATVKITPLPDKGE